jgi:hypothetical protein
MDLHVTGTGNRLEILFNGDQWWLERVGSNHSDDREQQPKARIGDGTTPHHQSGW